jgi:hypothetical protein
MNIITANRQRHWLIATLGLTSGMIAALLLHIR